MHVSDKTEVSMLGAIIGDIVGSIYEFRNVKSKNYILLSEGSFPTDDSMMTIAVSKALLKNQDKILGKIVCYKDDLYDSLVSKMVYYGNFYPRKSYGGRFKAWLKSPNLEPYGSYGNGSAMRVSPAGWICDNLEDTLEIAKITALPSHNHPEGIKGAQSVAAAIFILRIGNDKDYVKKYISESFGYDLNRTLDEIRQNYKFEVSCQKSVPEAFIAFLEGESFEDVIRGAVSLGGDSDTIAAIAGSLAEVIYPIEDKFTDYIQNHMSQFEELWDDRLEFYNKIVIPYKIEKGLADKELDMRVPDIIKNMMR